MEYIEYQYVSGIEMEFDNISIAASALRVSRNSMGVSNSIFGFDNSNRFFTPHISSEPTELALSAV